MPPRWRVNSAYYLHVSLFVALPVFSPSIVSWQPTAHPLHKFCKHLMEGEQICMYVYLYVVISDPIWSITLVRVACY